MPLQPSDVTFLQNLIAERSGQIVTADQNYLLDLHLKPIALEEGLETVEQLVAHARKSNSSRLGDRLTEAMTINETFFFRDLHPFNALQNTIVPEILERKKDKTLKIWTAACSSGQEPCTIGILLREHFPELSDWKVRITASDISDKVLRKAKSGAYTQFEVNRGMPVKLLVKYFSRNGDQWTVKNEVRDLMEFKKVNLAKPWFMADKFDIVFIRNVLIYFSVDTKTSILSRIHRSMDPNGYMFLGGGESLINVNVPFERESVDQTVVFRPKKTS